MNAWKHFCTITKHRWAVRRGCFAVGLYRQGLTHDLSKYSWTEFRSGIKYYQGTRSPNSRERDAPVPMPRRYFIEMVMDRIAACKIYHGKDYRDGDALAYFLGSSESRETSAMHPKTKEELIYVLTMLRDRGEKETFRFLRSVRDPNIPILQKNTEEHT